MILIELVTHQFDQDFKFLLQKHRTNWCPVVVPDLLRLERSFVSFPLIFDELVR
jgi:hypothetical protein